MNLFFVSDRCGHVVHRRICRTRADIDAGKEAVKRTPCLVCGESVRDKDILMVGLEDEWPGAPSDAVTSFDAADIPAFRTGKFADLLRGKLRDEALGRRKHDYELLSRALAPLIAGKRLDMAIQRGDHAAAVRLGELAVAEEKNPEERAKLQLMLAYSALQVQDLRHTSQWLRAAGSHAAAKRTAEQRMVGTATGYELGVHLYEGGDVDGALDAYLLAMEFGHPDFAARAAHNIGWAYEERGERRKAVNYYRIAAKSPNRMVAEKARGGLLRLGERRRPWSK